MGRKQVSSPDYEFGGPPGALGTMLGLPVAIFAFTSLCTGAYCVKPSNISDLQAHLPSSVDAIWSAEAFYVAVGWFLVQVLLERVLPCAKVQGVELPTGKKLTYRISGHLQLWVSVAGVLALHYLTPYKLFFVYDNFLQLASAAIVFSVALSVYLYATSFAKGALLAKGGNTGNHIYDFFIGRELNPRIGSLDLKQFCELRPGLIGWLVINISFLLKEHQLKGFVSPSMVLVNLFQGLYVWDALYNEKAILTTMDITTDGFGFMLAFGDLAWVPFIYSIQSRYLVEHDAGLSHLALAAIVALKVLGYIVFRGANGEKDAFRSNPNSSEVRHLKFLTTKSGRKLLTSGYWGMARKINYTGDWLMGLAWCLLCGTQDIVPYFYAIYFAILLVHRAIRDDHMCSEKYGADWKEYKKRVPCVFFPGII